MGSKPKESRSQVTDIPPRYPDTTPPSPSGDYSYTLEIVMQMQQSVGRLLESVDSLKERQKEQGAKLDKISHQIYAAIAVLAIATAIMGWLGTVVSKIIADVATHSITTPSQSSEQKK